MSTLPQGLSEDWDHLVRHLRETMGPEAQTPEGAAFVIQAASLLSKGLPVLLEDVRAALGWPAERVAGTMAYLKDCNEIECDGANRVVGIAGLSLKPTSHRFIVAGRTLYTWCAVDALFFPALLGKKAQVRSTCPGSGVDVRLVVTPHEVIEVAPAETVLSMVVPTVRTAETAGCEAEGCGPSTLYGPGGSFCGNAHFFSSEPAAATWLAMHPNALIMPVPQAFRLATEVWAKPLLQQR